MTDGFKWQCYELKHVDIDPMQKRINYKGRLEHFESIFELKCSLTPLLMMNSEKQLFILHQEKLFCIGSTLDTAIPISDDVIWIYFTDGHSILLVGRDGVTMMNTVTQEKKFPSTDIDSPITHCSMNANWIVTGGDSLASLKVWNSDFIFIDSLSIPEINVAVDTLCLVEPWLLVGSEDGIFVFKLVATPILYCILDSWFVCEWIGCHDCIVYVVDVYSIIHIYVIREGVDKVEGEIASYNLNRYIDDLIDEIVLFEDGSGLVIATRSHEYYCVQFTNVPSKEYRVCLLYDRFPLLVSICAGKSKPVPPSKKSVQYINQKIDQVYQQRKITDYSSRAVYPLCFD